MALSLTHDDHISGTVDQLEDWASILYPEIPDGHWIVAWCKPADGSRARTIWAQTTREAAEQAAPLVSTHHVYLSVGTRSEKTRGRGKREHVGQLAGFWCDIDTADGEHGAEGLPTRAQAIQAVEQLSSAGLEPSAIVDTGGGYHLYWLTTEPTSAQDSQKVYDEFGRNVSAYFGDQGIAVDPISADVARVMRWPGSLNHKMEPAPKVEHFTDGMKRYGTTTITTGFARLAPRPPVERPEPAGTPVSLPDGDRPGDWYNQHHDPGDLLANWWGWAEVPGESTSRYTAYKHPAATNTSSGGIYRDYDDGLPRFYSFTTSTELPAGRTFTAFDLYAFRQHNGDIPAAAKAIRREMMPKKDTAPMSAEQTRHLAPVPDQDQGEEERPLLEIKVARDHVHIADKPIEWNVQGFLSTETALIFGGPKKSLKSTLLIHLSVCLAAGIPLFGQLAVPRKRKTLIAVGEGGERLFLSRVKRICAGYGLNEIPEGLTYSMSSFEMSPEASGLQVNQIARSEGIDFIGIDPFYRYRGGGATSSDVFDMGRVLADFTAPMIEDGRTIGIAHHFRGSAAGFDLDNFTQAGAAEFADSWVLLQHEETPDPDTGKYRLAMEAGSRQWGARRYSLAYDDGPFDQEAGHFSRHPSWDFQRTTLEDREKADRQGKAVQDAKLELLQAARRARKAHTQTDWIGLIGKRTVTVKAAFLQLVDEGFFVADEPSKKGSVFSPDKSHHLWGE